jgi:hypothetical protein
MISIGSASHGRARRRHLRLDDGFEYFKGEWLEAGQDPTLSPTMFLVEQGPHSKLAPHFHRENEFQLVVQGDGTFGSHRVAAVTVHYAGAYTGYGPVIAGEQGLSYFTIRAVFEQGAVMLPEGRDQMIRGPKRQLHSTPFAVEDPSALAQRQAMQTDDVIPEQPDRVAARRLLLPPDGRAHALDTAGSSGQFSIVLAGSLVHGATVLTRWESLFSSPDEAPLPLRAGPGGADVLSLRLARKAPEYAQRPSQSPGDRQ